MIIIVLNQDGYLPVGHAWLYALQDNKFLRIDLPGYLKNGNEENKTLNIKEVSQVEFERLTLGNNSVILESPVDIEEYQQKLLNAHFFKKEFSLLNYNCTNAVVDALKLAEINIYNKEEISNARCKKIIPCCYLPTKIATPSDLIIYAKKSKLYQNNHINKNSAEKIAALEKKANCLENTSCLAFSSGVLCLSATGILCCITNPLITLSVAGTAHRLFRFTDCLNPCTSWINKKMQEVNEEIHYEKINQIPSQPKRHEMN